MVIFIVFIYVLIFGEVEKNYIYKGEKGFWDWIYGKLRLSIFIVMYNVIEIFWVFF